MKYITRKEIAEKLNIVPDAVRKLELRGVLPAESIKLKGNIVVYLLTPELETWMSSKPIKKKDYRRDARLGLLPPLDRDVQLLREFLQPGLRFRRTHDEDMAKCQWRT